MTEQTTSSQPQSLWVATRGEVTCDLHGGMTLAAYVAEMKPGPTVAQIQTSRDLYDQVTPQYAEAVIAHWASPSGVTGVDPLEVLRCETCHWAPEHLRARRTADT